MKYLIDRLKEPSTWAGLSVLTALLGVPMEHVNAVHGVVAAALGAVAIFKPDLVKG
jgi:hypothetical protein